MSLRISMVCLLVSMLTLGCTVQTGTSTNDPSSVGAPTRTKANPRRADPRKVEPRSNPSAPARTPPRTPATPQVER